jgi:esterase
MTDFVPHAVLFPGDRPGGRLALVLHGILGSHKNWRTFTRVLARRLPGWRFALLDLRNHGDSSGAPGPHTLAACADDLERLAEELGASPEVVIGHSFGGKVALELGARAPEGLSTIFVLDASPERHEVLPDADHEVQTVLAALRAVPQPLARRNDVLLHLAAAGMPRSIQLWMTTNLRPGDGGFVWTFDLDAATAMLEDYFRTDSWGPLLTTDPSAPAVHLIRAERSDRWTTDVLRKLDKLPAAGRGSVHLLPDAGHWVHVDNPAGLSDLLVRMFPT